MHQGANMCIHLGYFQKTGFLTKHRWFLKIFEALGMIISVPNRKNLVYSTLKYAAQDAVCMQL